MMKKGLIALAAIISGLVLPLGAQADVKVSDELSIYGDGRARFEMDDRTKKSGTSYVDEKRDRMRYRLRAGFVYSANENLEFGGRIASGTGDRSPHVIMGSDDNSDAGTAGFSKDSMTIDKAFIKGKYMDGFAWFGKNDIPFWEQNEYFWDGDVTPEGIALGYTLKNLGPISVTLQGGSFTIDEFGWESSSSSLDDYTLLTYQGVVKASFDFADFTAAYGVAATDNAFTSATTTTANITTGAVTTTTTKTAGTDVNYSLASLQAKVKAIPNVGITLGYDMMKSDASSDDKGSVISASVSIKDFSVTLLLPDIESNAVSAFAQDDWPNYASDFKGYEGRIGYKIAKNMNVDIRRYDGEKKSDSKQTETRNQINFNVNF